MVQNAHNLGIKVIVDIVVNHMSDLLYFDGYPSLASGAPFHFHTGEYKWVNDSVRIILQAHITEI